MSKKDKLLGMPVGTATNRLRKLILFDLARQLGRHTCFRCNEPIESSDDLSIEHKLSWQSANDPVESFFSLDNIAFSHLRCNSAAANLSKTHCPNGHKYSDDNTYRRNGARYCKQCKSDYRRRHQG